LRGQQQLDEFELFVQCFAHGKTVGFPVETIEKAFESQLELLVQEENLKEWKVKYDETERCRILAFNVLPPYDLITMMGIQRPCNDPRLWESLFALLSTGYLGLYFTAPHFWKQKNFIIIAGNADIVQFPTMPNGIRRVSSAEGICRELEAA
jgi:hypothetical protein